MISFATRAGYFRALARTAKRRKQLCAAAKKYRRKQAAHFRALGLTLRGTMPKYQLHFQNHKKKPHGKYRKKLYQRMKRKNLMANGFTTRGRSRWSVKERQWRQFRSSLNLSPVFWGEGMTVAGRCER